MISWNIVMICLTVIICIALIFALICFKTNKGINKKVVTNITKQIDQKNVKEICYSKSCINIKYKD